MRIMVFLALGLIAAPAVMAAVPTTKQCLTNREIRAKRLSAADGYYVKTNNGWWRNTGAACPAFAPDRALATRSTVDSQCRGDLVTVFEPFSRFEYGGCVLGGWEKVAGPPATPVSGGK